MNVEIQDTSSVVQTGAKDLQNRLGLDSSPVTLNGMFDVFENGVMATVRVGAERFGFSVRLSDLGIVPTRSKSKDKTQAAIDAVLRSSQRASLLPRDQMWHIEESGARIVIPRPENSERQIRMLFPTRYDAEKPGTEGEHTDQRTVGVIPAHTLWAIPMNGMTFIPESSFPRWKEDLDRAQAAHARTAELIVANYDRLVASSLRHYERIALDVYSRLLQTSSESVEKINALEFTRRWKRAVIRSWPTKEEIIANFSVEARFFWVPMPSRLQEDLSRTQELRWQQEERAAEREVKMQISSAVRETRASQVHELTVSYVKTILEKTEHVFINFLSFLDESERSPSPQQLNAIVNVVEMIRVLGTGVSTFDSIRGQAESISTLIEEYRNTPAPLKAKQAKGRLRSPDDKLPEAIAQAVRMIRVESEGMIGREARRTSYSDQDPDTLLQSIWATKKEGTIDRRSSFRKVSSEIEDDSEMIDNLVSNIIEKDEETPYRAVREISSSVLFQQ